MRRRICPTGLMNRQTNEAARLLRKCIDDMIRYMEEDASGARTGGRRDLLNSGSKDGKEFFDAMNDVMVWAGKPNLADFLPVSKWLDPQGIKRNMVRDMGRALEIVSNFVKERVDELKLAESSAIEWAMAELLRKPDSMKKMKEEINRVIGTQRKVEESDIDNLPYLQAVIKETLRLYPVVPLLLPRNAMQGISLAHKVVHLGMATLLHSFDWELGNNICPETIDMNERVGITTRKLIPSEAIPKKRVMDAR
ncbi:hypothetical protein GOBAR_AA15038 [Gossypium barbadense]|uniref:Cytochrome P450 n=1 Tax=Gossypium barbadense TaxID=3634 RepID=A0A2P5XQJ7_GOSBA|nr:hypothetical protein GOBAR_AA15038 [Gossypium barbadense]